MVTELKPCYFNGVTSWRGGRRQQVSEQIGSIGNREKESGRLA